MFFVIRLFFSPLRRLKLKHLLAFQCDYNLRVTINPTSFCCWDNLFVYAPICWDVKGRLADCALQQYTSVCLCGLPIDILPILSHFLCTSFLPSFPPRPSHDDQRLLLKSGSATPRLRFVSISPKQWREKKEREARHVARQIFFFCVKQVLP